MTLNIPFDNSYARLPGTFYTRLNPEPVGAPSLIAYNDALGDFLGFSEASDAERAAVFSGATLPDGATPLAQLYAGHQFGNFNPQLGDGRAILLGEVIGGHRAFNFDIQIHLGAGSYVCGEESAMIESIEGRRGMPRLRPPYIAEVGLFGRPTLEHNLETLYWVPEILDRGADWFLSHGRRGRAGLRNFSVSGRVRRPGVYLAPAGISVRELIDDYGGGMPDGHDLKAYLPGGASGGILPASLAELPLDFDTLQEYGCFIGSAAVVVLISLVAPGRRHAEDTSRSELG